MMREANSILPLVSVVIPCFNAAATVAAAIDSVLTQDYPALEILVIDDGSTDNSLEVLAGFGDAIILIQQQNSGAGAARNTGLKAASGQFVAFIDSDDIWLPGKLSAQIDYLLQHPEMSLCYCGWMEWDGKTPLERVTKNLVDHAPQISQKSQGKEGWLYLDLLRESVIHTISLVMRREVLDVVGLFNTDYIIGEDYDYWLRASQHFRIAKLAQVYALYRNNPESITKKVHSTNYRLLILQSAIAKYGGNCPSGEQCSPTVLNNYLGARHFNYGYNAMLQGHRKLAMDAFKICICKEYRLVKACMLYSICAWPWLYSQYIKYRKGH